MRVSLPARRRPTVLEQLLGRRRARRLRRRIGLLAVGAGVSMLKPRTRWAPAAVAAVVTLSLVVGLGLRPV